MKIRWYNGAECEVPDDIGRAAVASGRAVEILPPPDATDEKMLTHAQNKERRAPRNKSIQHEQKS